MQYRNVRTTEDELITGYKYEYDELGNIEKIYQSQSPFNLLVEYTYDSQNQLTREVHYDGAGTADSNITKSYTYAYDTAGNILSEAKTEGGTTTTKTYSYTNTQWRDLLTGVTVNTGTEQTLSYDGSGNPTSYYNGEKNYTNLTWQQGRDLTSVTVGGATTTYAYDMDGIRTQKTVGGVVHTYVTQNGKLVRESFPYGTTTIIMDFIYDESGRPFAVSYSKNGGSSYTNYFYALNAQGDVEGLFRVTLNGKTGKYEHTWYGRYTYDAWGNVTATTAAGNVPGVNTLVYRNPIRYRGYVYDNETGWYYLQSRYYDPANHRFINADSLASTGQSFTGTNMFAYCNNCPVVYGDPTGHIAKYASVALFDDGGKAIRISLAETLYEAGTQTRLFTNEDNNEYICGIYKMSDGKYMVGEYYKGTHASASILPVLDEAEEISNGELIAFLHSHPYCTGHIPNDFSYKDEYGKLGGDFGVVVEYNKPLFLAAPNGDLMMLGVDFFEENGKQHRVPVVWIIEDVLPVDDTLFNCLEGSAS